tara:strand:+ start:51 stop:218 length:168 start_codon:yes stop_codon:yes gene_type:complete
MIHSLEDKNKKELVEICKIQIEEYQLLEKEVAELKGCLEAWVNVAKQFKRGTDND